MKATSKIAASKAPTAPTAPTLTAAQLNRATLARQLLLARETHTVMSAVEQLAGLQAQLARPPFVGLWSRLEGFRRHALLDALHDRSVVRVTAMRGTLHLMSAADYILLRGALQPALDRGMQAVKGRPVIDDLEALHADAREFFGTKTSTFDRLRIYFKDKYPEADERAMAYVIRMRLPLVQGADAICLGLPGCG